VWRLQSVALSLTILFLGAGGYLLTSTAIRHDRDHAAERRAQVEAVHMQEILGRARAYVAGLADVLAGEHARGQARFSRLARGTSAGVGLDDVEWVQRVPAAERERYEREHRIQITRLTRAGGFAPAPPAGVFFPATYTSRTRPELRPGVDVGGVPGLGPAIRDRRRIFAVSASEPGILGSEHGFYLLEAATFAKGPEASGYLVAFVPRGWFTATLGGDPRGMALVEDGRTIDGDLESADASASFALLGRQWRIDIEREPPSQLQSMLPWLALAWPFAAAAVMLLVWRAIALRRRAQGDVERLFELSLDPIAIIGFDGRYHAVNPGFVRTLGYPRQELLSRPQLQFVHPDDRERASEAFTGVLNGRPVELFESRFLCADGSVRWLQWSGRPVPDRRVVFGIARDVTDRRRTEAEQAALRRVATLVAREASQAEVFTAIAEEIGQLLNSDEIRMERYEDERASVVVAAWGSLVETLPVGSRRRLDADGATARVFRTGRPARIDDYSRLDGPTADAVRALGLRSVVGTPIYVEGRLWGAINAGTSGDAPLPPDTEARLSRFTELMATAIANTESRARADRLGDEQAALRRVATIVAKEAPPAEVFAKVAEEVASVLGEAECSVFRAEGDGTATLVAVWGRGFEGGEWIGVRFPVDGDGVIATVLRSGEPFRVDDYAHVTGALASRARDEFAIRSGVGCPILVSGRVWGAIGAARHEAEAFPPETEARLTRFAELAATAVANADARAQVTRLVEEQTALRRIATLVAEGAAPAAVLDAVAAEMEALLDADGVGLSRFESDDEITIVANRGMDATKAPVGSRWSSQGESITAIVRRTRRPARIEPYRRREGEISALAASLGVRAAVGAPIVVDGRLWGVVIANWRREGSPPPDTEERMARFAELLDTAIANADSRDQLSASRARLVTEADDARRRVVRDLHDGAQQRLVHTIITLKLALRSLDQDRGAARGRMEEALEQAQAANVELRELAHGLLPGALTRGGLRAGVDAVVERLELPVRVEVPAERFPQEIEASAYFIVAEALTNVVKHAHAASAEVRAHVQDGMLHVEVSDDGAGGADPDGHGLVGIADRVTALGGRLEIDSPPGGGTRLTATLALSAG
jgi:PAS domain S-box-containing protein